MHPMIKIARHVGAFVGARRAERAVRLSAPKVRLFTLAGLVGAGLTLLLLPPRRP